MRCFCGCDGCSGVGGSGNHTDSSIGGSITGAETICRVVGTVNVAGKHHSLVVVFFN